MTVTMTHPHSTSTVRNNRDLINLLKYPERTAIRIHSLVADSAVEALLHGLQRGGWPLLRSLVITTIVTPTSQLLKALKEGALVNLRVLAFSCSCWSPSDMADLVCILMDKTTTPHLQHLILLRTSREDVISSVKALSAVRPLLKIELRSLV